MVVVCTNQADYAARVTEKSHDKLKSNETPKLMKCKKASDIISLDIILCNQNITLMVLSSEPLTKTRSSFELFD